MKRNVLCATIGGIAIGVLLVISSFLPYLKMEAILIPSIVLGSMIVAAVLLYKNYSFKYAVLRTLLLFACALIVIRLFAITGIVEKIGNILHIQESEATSRASGLGMAFLLTINLLVSIIINGILLICSWIKCKIGDSSLS